MRIFTDASTENKYSGIAFVAIDAEHNIVLENSTVLTGIDNNTAELQAILFALRSIPNSDERVVILSDSLYATNCVKNNQCRYFEKDILEEIQKNLRNKHGRVMWIKGHTSDGTYISIFNKEADSLANKARRDYVESRKKGKKQLSKLKRMFRRGQQRD